METVLDLLGSLIDWDPTGLIGRRWIKKYQAGERVFVRGTVSSLVGSARWAVYLVADGGRLCVAKDKRNDTELYPLPPPSPGSTVEECLGNVRGKAFHYRYEASSGSIEVYPGAPAAGYLVKEVLEDMDKPG